MINSIRSCPSVGKWITLSTAFEKRCATSQAFKEALALRSPLYCLPAKAIVRITNYLPSDSCELLVGLLSGIESLNFSNNQTLDDTKLARILKNCPALKRLDVSGCKKLTPHGFATLLLPPTLEVFHANDTAIDEAGFKNLMDNCRDLRQLHLAHATNLMVDCVDPFTYPNTLVNVDLSQGLILGDGLKKLLSECPSLSSIRLMGCMGITSVDFQSLEWPQSLKVIDLSRTHLTIQGLHQLFTKAVKMKEFTMKECIHLPLDDLDAPFPESLEGICLDRNLGDLKRFDLFVSCKNLKRLTFDECPDLSAISRSKIFNQN